jgi:hypothetical protein
MLMGYGRHGKDTVAEYLRDKYGYTFTSSSWACAEELFPLFKLFFGYKDVDQCFEDRHGGNRPIWHEAIKLINKGDKAYLGRKIYSENDIYVGIRCIEEFRAIKRKKLFDFSIWVDRSEVLPPEGKGSCTVTKEDAEIVLDNNGTLEDLYRRIDKLVLAMETTYGNS